MVHIETVRSGLICIAVHINEATMVVTVGAGFTKRGAEKRCLKLMEKEVV